jgi:hypothetical protein
VHIYTGTNKRINNDKNMAARLYPLYAAIVDGSQPATPFEYEDARKRVTLFKTKYGEYKP